MNASTSTILSGLLSLWLSFPAIAADFSGNLKGVAITDVLQENKPPVAQFTTSVTGSTVTADANGSFDSDGTIIEYTWDFGDGAIGSGVQVQHTYATKADAPITLTLVDNANGVTITQQTVTFAAPVAIAVNFQPANVPIPDGFKVDSGGAFNATTGYGWVISPGTTGTRDRNSSLSPDQSYDTMIHVAPQGVWEIDLPDGTYSITICIGDASYPTGLSSIKVEGITFFDNVALSSTNRWIERSNQVTVQDGKLTLEFTGSDPYSRLCWLKITQ